MCHAGLSIPLCSKKGVRVRNEMKTLSIELHNAIKTSMSHGFKDLLISKSLQELSSIELTEFDAFGDTQLTRAATLAEKPAFSYVAQQRKDTITTLLMSRANPRLRIKLGKYP